MWRQEKEGDPWWEEDVGRTAAERGKGKTARREGKGSAEEANGETRRPQTAPGLSSRSRAEAQLSNEKFVSRAPANVIQAQRDKLEQSRKLLAQLAQSEARLRKLKK